MRTIGAGFDSKPFASESASKKVPTLNEQINLFLEQSGFEQMEKPGSLESSKKQRDPCTRARRHTGKSQRLVVKVYQSSKIYIR